MYYNIARGQTAVGCDMCLIGAKSVIFITGLCPLSCYYCPVDRERFGKDVMYVNDVLVQSVEEAVEVVKLYASEGAAITGGDPATVPERVNSLAEALKREFGRAFHIHVYSHILNLNNRAVGVLAAGEIDEVRIHLTSRRQALERERYVKALAASGKTVGIEVPALPGFEREIAEAINALAPYVSFVNINELDVSEANLSQLKAAGYSVRGLNVAGSLEAAMKIASMVSLPVHICLGRTKDVVQIGARLFRHAMVMARHNEYVNDDGTVAYGERGVHPKNPLAGQTRLKLPLGSRELEIT